MQKIKLEAENDLEKRCKNLKEQNEALISGLDLANETISNLYGLLREYCQQKAFKTKYKTVSDLYCNHHSSCNHYDY